jgi:predicted membrane-bound spermidine synthase
MRSSAALGYRLLFFLSGATGLVYQLLWVRVLYQTFGSTIQSITTVVAAYMGGLGLGAWLLGRVGDRHPKPAALYGWLEVAIGVFGIVSPVVLMLAHKLYVGIAGAMDLPAFVSMVLRFGLAALVLLIPTTLMGGTLPVLTRAFMGDDRARLRAAVGGLYGLNTLGAVVGTGLAGFFLIEHLGIRTSLWITAAANLVLGVVGIVMARPLAVAAPAPEPAPAAAPAGRDPLRVAALVLLAVTAFASLLNEIAWTRVLVMIVGGSTYAFTLILLVFLLGIGLGSAFFVGRHAPPRDTAASAALAQGFTAAGAALLFVFFNALPVYIIAVFQVQFLDATARLLLMGVAVGAVVLVPAIGMGMTFPLLTDLVARPGAARGADVGRAYALNTIGSIAGAALTGFVLVVVLGTEQTLRLGLVLSGAAALTLAYLAARGVAEGSDTHARLRNRVLLGGGLAAVGLTAAFAAPQWSSRLIDLGPTIYARQPMNATGLQAYLTHRGVRQVDFREGPNATVSVWESEGGRSLKVNGKADASDYGDMDTQVLVGLAPAAARPDPRSAFVIGWGSGVTARVVADVPGMERVHAVEIEPAVLAMDPYFRHVNDSVMLRPNVQVTVDDARSALQLSRERFDIIMSEPSNPWLAGIATLYTPEFYRIARSRLADDGVFGQWVQLYQLPLPVVAGIVQNLQAVFPHVQVWFGGVADIVVLASPQPIRYDAAWLDRLLAPGTPLGELGREWLGLRRPGDVLGHYLLGAAGLPQLLQHANLVHRDDHPQLEYVAARRFLDYQGTGILDSLIAMGQAGAAEEGRSPQLLARSFGARRGEGRGAGYIDAARRLEPDNPEWLSSLAFIRLGQGDTAFAETTFARIAARDPRNAEALLVLGQIATAARNAPRAEALLVRALAAGGDTVQAHAALALLAARAHRWDAAAVAVRRVLTGHPRHTFRHPFPHATVGDALGALATDGPPALADSLVTAALELRPGWSRMYALRAAAALRAHDCERALDTFMALLDFGIDRPDWPGLVQQCRDELSGRSP